MAGVVTGLVSGRAGRCAPCSKRRDGACFRTTRDELVGDRPLFGSAEIARALCAAADRLVSVVAVTPGRIRRVDCWLGGAGIVAHGASPDPMQAAIGSVSGREHAAELTGSLVAALTGGLPLAPAGEPIEIGVVGSVGPGCLPGRAEWVAIVSARGTGSVEPPDRVVVAARGRGLALSPIASLDDAISAPPASPADLERALRRLLGPAPASLVDLLAGDPPRSPGRDVLTD